MPKVTQLVSGGPGLKYGPAVPRDAQAIHILCPHYFQTQLGAGGNQKMQAIATVQILLIREGAYLCKATLLPQ